MVISNLKIGTSYFFTPLQEFAKENIRYRLGRDVDRNDLHQIHMYAGYFSKTENLVAAGLLYPCSKNPEKNWSAELNLNTDSDSNFIIDGINIGEVQNVFDEENDTLHETAFEKLIEQENLFIERIRSFIEK